MLRQPSRPALRYHGGKWMLAPWLLTFFPEHRVYVEPFGGGMSVLLRKPRANSNRSGTTPAHDWANYAEVFPALVERLRGVVIENRDAGEVMEAQDSPATLLYVDPPYPASTRGPDVDYTYELTDDDHRALAARLHAVAGMVVLSGYPCDLYDRELYGDWQRFERAHLADGARPRTEVIWLSPACSEALDAGRAQSRLIA